MRSFFISFLLLSVPVFMFAQKSKLYTIATLDPGHFHAALVQKTMYPNVAKEVYVYAKPSADLDMHLKRITDYNNRKESPTNWKEVLYTGDDFFKKLISDKKANLVMLSGNNELKSEYILTALQNGLNVIADKPMAIDAKGFEKIKKSFVVAKQNKLQLYDIMTERFEITSILQRLLAQEASVFGTLEKGTKEHPAIEKKNVHMLYKTVSGNVLTRPEWFMDITKQGEGIADVMTHVVDLVQWVCFPNQVIDYKKDIKILDANHWPTNLTLSQFSALTHATAFPSYLQKQIIKDSILPYYCNGEILYQLKGVYVKTTTLWNYKSEYNAGDMYSSYMRGTKATLKIQQGPNEAFKPVLYIIPNSNDAGFEKALNASIAKLQTEFLGVGIEKTGEGYKVTVPNKFNENHEEHFGRVVQFYLGYLDHNNMPNWEVPNMLAKYYTTTSALTLAQSKK
jgi:predicted dehydrogenase